MYTKCTQNKLKLFWKNLEVDKNKLQVEKNNKKKNLLYKSLTLKSKNWKLNFESELNLKTEFELKLNLEKNLKLLKG